MKKMAVIVLILVAGFFLTSVITVSYLYFNSPTELLKNLYPMVNVVNPSGDFRITFRHNKPYNWVELKDISPLAVAAIVVSEDWAFYDHSGVDLNQLKKAVFESINEEKSLRGASTISQQAVKNIFLDQSRSFKRKLIELIYTLKLEQDFSKEKILEFYLNIVEFDKNIFGIHTASYHYFAKHPKNLTAREGAFLAMVLPSPKKYSVSFREQKLTPFAEGVIDSILIKLRQAKYLNETERIEALSQKFVWEMDTTEFIKDVLDTHRPQQ